MTRHAAAATTAPDAPAVYQEPTPFYKHLLRFLFGHVGLFFLAAAFAAGGAWVYIQLELPAEEQRYALKRLKAADIQDGMNYMSSLFWHYHGKNMSFQDWDRKVQINMRTMEQFIIGATENFNYDGTVDEWNYDWVFPKALLFTITIMTTIGYGHIAPITFAGQMFTIIYAMIGTPLLLVFLANVGDTMATAFTYTYSRICCRWCRGRRYQSEAGFGKKVKRLANDNIGGEDYMPTGQVMVPITINMVLILVYLVMGAKIFSEWEGWDMASSCYFSFVTLSTIGFGDMVPGNSFLDYKDGGSAAFKMIVTILYCIFGMALISMCIQMMQDQIVSKVHWFAVETGIIDSEQTAANARVKYKRSRKGVMETPIEKPDADPSRKKKRKKKKEKQEKQEADEAARGEKQAADEAERGEAQQPVEANTIRVESRAELTDRLIDEEMSGGQA